VSGVGRRGMCVLERSGDRRREGQFLGICDALFSNYFEDLLCHAMHVTGTALVDRPAYIQRIARAFMAPRPRDDL